MSKWRPIHGFDGYFVSKRGEIYSAKSGIVLKPQLMAKTARPNDRHLYVLLYRRGAKPRRVAVHQMVARTFISPPPTPSHEVNHKNGHANDNRLSNLEWATRAENGAHAAARGLKATGARHGRMTQPGSTARGNRHGRAKLSESDVVAILRAHSCGNSQASLAERFNVSVSLVSQIVRREIWTHINWRRATPIIMG